MVLKDANMLPSAAFATPRWLAVRPYNRFTSFPSLEFESVAWQGPKCRTSPALVYARSTAGPVQGVFPPAAPPPPPFKVCVLALSSQKRAGAAVFTRGCSQQPVAGTCSIILSQLCQELRIINKDPADCRF